LTVLGVDIGNAGAVALIDEVGELLEVCDMPILADGPHGRPALNAPLLAAIVAKTGVSQAYVERVGPRPTDGAVHAFAFGRWSRGFWPPAAFLLPFLTPPQWKRLVGIAPGKAGAKDAARSAAIRRWPGKAALFARVKDDGRAEACLICLAGLETTSKPYRKGMSMIGKPTKLRTHSR
jgi:hypothetical protein